MAAQPVRGRDVRVPAGEGDALRAGVAVRGPGARLRHGVDVLPGGRDAGVRGVLGRVGRDGVLGVDGRRERGGVGRLLHGRLRVPQRRRRALVRRVRVRHGVH